MFSFIQKMKQGSADGSFLVSIFSLIKERIFNHYCCLVMGIAMVLSVEVLELKLGGYGYQTRLLLKSLPTIRIYTSIYIMMW